MNFKDYFLLTEGKSQQDTFCYMLYTEQPYTNYLKEIQDSLNLDGEKTEKNKFHTTVRYVKTSKSPQPLLDYLSDVDLPKLTGFTKNFEIFGEHERCLVMELRSKEIHDWFKQVNRFLLDCDFPDSDFPTYKPHITLSCETTVDKPKFVPKDHKLKIDFTKHVVTDSDYNVIFERSAK